MVQNTRFLSAVALAVMGLNAQTAQGMDPNKGLKKVFIPFCQDLPAGEGRVIRIPQNIPNKTMGTQEGQSTPTSTSTETGIIDSPISNSIVAAAKLTDSAPQAPQAAIVLSQEIQINPIDQTIIDFINKHAPNTYDTKNKDRETLENYATAVIAKDPNYKCNKYGGLLGKEFFGLMQTALLEEFCQNINKAKESLPAKATVSDNFIKNIFNDMLITLGKDRARIARITGTEKAKKFGSRNFSDYNPGLMDAFDKNEPWPQWYQLLKTKVQDITKGMDLSKIYSQVSAPGQSVNIPYGNTTLELTFAGPGKYGIYLHHSEDKPFEPAFKQEVPRLGDRSAAYYWVLRSPNMESLFPRDEKEMIYCYRKPGIGQQHRPSHEILSTGLSHFKNILYWDGKSDNELVVSDFTSLLWKMTHQSIYERGQAAITKWFLSSLAKVNGYELKFSDEWNAELNHATEDLQALLELDHVTFLNDCNKKNLLKLENKINNGPILNSAIAEVNLTNSAPQLPQAPQAAMTKPGSDISRFLPLPEKLIGVILNFCQGSFNTLSLVSKDFRDWTDEHTTSLKPKRNWVFDIFQYSPSINDLLNNYASGGRAANMGKNKTYFRSLLDKGKISYSQTNMIYPVFTNLLTRFKNLTSLDLYLVNISNPTESSVSFFTENSLEKLTNLQFLHISPSNWLGAPGNIYSEKPEDTQNRLSILREQLKKLTNLSILICSGNLLTDDLLECLPKLRNLDLSKNQLVTNEGVKKLPGLEYLCLGKNTSISPQTLQAIPKLMFLDIKYNKGYTNEDILAIPNLKILFANCSNLNIKSGFHGLKTIENSDCYSFYCKFTNYLFDMSYDEIGDPYETFLLKLEEKAKTNS